MMKPYIISLAVGIIVGGFYGLIGVRSPAPPLVAVLGLVGMLCGQQIVAMIRAPF